MDQDGATGAIDMTDVVGPVGAPGAPGTPGAAPSSVFGAVAVSIFFFIMLTVGCDGCQR